MNLTGFMRRPTRQTAMGSKQGRHLESGVGMSSQAVVDRDRG